MTPADDGKPGDGVDPITWRTANRLALLLILVFGVLYVGKTWSPSSYGHVLQQYLGYTESRPDWGKPRPIRSDEWGVVTPLTQATVNNHFERYNRTSLYSEDLRMNYGLPLHDWGLAFKPTLWLYGVVNPAYAYSFHWFILSALFLVGYAWLFRWLGATPVVGYALSAGLYFTGFVQFWWNEKGPEFALFPWVILPFATRLPLLWKAALFYWVAVVWLLTNFYPPVQISLAFVGLILLLAREPTLFKPRPMLVLSLVAALAAGTAALYLWDYLQATATTIYPGQRRVSGVSLPARLWISWFLPTINSDHQFESFVGGNVCENGTLGLYYALLVPCFLDFGRWQAVWGNTARRREIAILGGGLALMVSWMALPIPSWVGSLLLWDRVQPQRMQYAAGILFVCLLYSLVKHLGLRLSFGRLAVFLGATVYGLWTWKFAHGEGDNKDLVILILAPIAFAAAYFRPRLTHASLALASVIAGIVLFGRFNPLQSAWPIFNRFPNAVTQGFDYLAESNGGVLAVSGLPGAVGNGLGYRSVSHVTTVPQLEFWRGRFPNLTSAEFDAIFNRYSHIIPLNEGVVRLLQADAIVVPIYLFQSAAEAPIRYSSSPNLPIEAGGYVDSVTLEAERLIISGWGPWSGPRESHELEIFIVPPPSGPPTRALVPRPDLPAATEQRVSALNGFSVTIPLSHGKAPSALCIVAFDASTGRRTLLNNPPNLPSCIHAGKAAG